MIENYGFLIIDTLPYINNTARSENISLSTPVKSPTSKGKNIHIIAGISQQGLVHWERRRGNYKLDDCCEWVRRMLRAVTEPFNNVVVACDNAPVHCALETVFDDDEEFSGATLLRAIPYSAPINPIEERWSIMKAKMKRICLLPEWQIC